MINNWLTWSLEPTNSQLISAISTIVLVFFTGILAIFTGVLAKKTAVLAKMTSQPFVICSLDSSEVDATALNLTLRNTGNGAAFDVKLELSPSLPEPNGNPATDEKFTRNVSLLPPENALTLRVVMGRDVHDKNFTATISWASRPGAKNRETLSYTFSPYDGFQAGVSTKGLHHIAKELEKIRRNLTKNDRVGQRH